MPFQSYKPKKSSPLSKVFTNSTENESSFSSFVEQEPSKCYKCQALVATTEAIKSREVHCKRNRTSLIGPMEESLLHGMTSASISTPTIFEAVITIDHEIGYSTMMPAIFHKWTNDDYQAPYVGTINLAKLSQNGIGIAIKKVGNLSINIYNDEGKKARKIKVDYDFRQIPQDVRFIARYSNPKYTIQTSVLHLSGDIYFCGQMKIIFHNKDEYTDFHSWVSGDEGKGFIIMGSTFVDANHYTQPCYLCKEDDVQYFKNSYSSSYDSLSLKEEQYSHLTKPTCVLGEPLAEKDTPYGKIFNDYSAGADAFLSDSFVDDYSVFLSDSCSNF